MPLARCYITHPLPIFKSSSNHYKAFRPSRLVSLSMIELISTSPSVTESASWELDFSSRPILDTRGKKLWELLITDAHGSFVFSEILPNNQINSVSLKTAIQKYLNDPRAKRPIRCRFFRAKMYTIISRALTDLEISPLPSRRCFSLMALLEKRFDLAYKQHPGYNDSAGDTSGLNLLPPTELPDALRGESWAFVQLPLSELLKTIREVDEGNLFGSSFDIKSKQKNMLGMLIPGVAVFSRRANPLAAWTNGLELAALTVDLERACLLLETGIDTRLRYGSYQKNKATDQEAQAWEKAKKIANGIHFLAIQSDPASDQVAGLWLLIASEQPKF